MQIVENFSLSNYLEEINQRQKADEIDKEDFLLNRFLVMEDVMEEKTTEQAKLSSEYYLSKIELQFHNPMLVPIEPKGVITYSSNNLS